jgi:ornithine cyclodeaminase
VLLRSDIYVEYASQSRIKGEIQQLAHDYPVTELWEVIAGRAPGGQDGSDYLVRLCRVCGRGLLGPALVRAKLREWRYYADLDLLADPDDPRDLFGMLLRAANAPLQLLS